MPLSDYYDPVLKNISKPGPDVSTVGRVPLSYRGSRSATWVVAAAEASHRMRQMADFRCDGAADEVEVQAALDRIPTTGGKIILSEGTFNFSSPVARAIGNVMIEGLGRSTHIQLDGSTPVISAGVQTGWVLQDFDTDAGGVDIADAPQSIARYWKGGIRVGDSIATYNLLDQMIAILGTTRLMFYPCLQGCGPDVHTYGVLDTGDLAAHARQPAGAVNLEDEFDPVRLAAPGMHAYFFDQALNNHMIVADCDHITHGDGSVDSPASWGIAILPTEKIGDQCSLISKFNMTGSAEEFDFRHDNTGHLVLELHDASASASEVATASAVIVPWVWNILIATYDGNEADPDVHLYQNGIDLNPTGATTENGSYVAMENTPTDLMIGARNLTGTVQAPYNGYLTLPFSCGKELLADEVSCITDIEKILIGLL